MTQYDPETGEVDRSLEVYEPNDLALRTDAELIAMSEQALEFTVSLLSNGLPLDEVAKTRGKQQALSKLLATHIRTREARLEAANNITEARLRTERHTGRLIPQLQGEGVLATSGSNDKAKLSDASMTYLADFQITRDQSSTWQKEAAHPEEVFDDYVATAKENLWEMSTVGFLRFAKKGDDQLINQSLSNEWYTPPEYVNAARLVMGGIDLDPASCEYANQIIQASHIYTMADSGLDHDWQGRVWLNPPYGRDEDNTPNQRVWSERLIQQHGDGNVIQAVMLVNAVTDRAWFQPLWNYPMCFVEKRIRFYSKDTDAGQPTHGNVLVYFGEHVATFYSHFKQFGRIVLPSHLYEEAVLCTPVSIAA